MAAAPLVPSRRQLAIGAGFLALLVLPLSLIGWALGAPLALAALPGVAVGFVVTLQAKAIRPALLAVALMAVLAFVSTLAASSAIAAALWLGLVGLAYGLGGLRGWHRLTMQMAIWCSYIVVNPLQADAPSKLARIGVVQADLRAALVTALAVVLAGAAVALLVDRVKGRTPPRPLEPLTPRAAWIVGIACGTLLAIGAAIVLSAYRVPASEWLLLTIVVLIQPGVHATLRHTIERVAGTIAGVIAAGLLGVALGTTPLRPLLGLVLMAIAFAYLQMPQRYWAYVGIFTSGLVLISAPPAETDAVAAYRLGFTLAGATAVAAVAIAVSELGRLTRPSSG